MWILKRNGGWVKPNKCGSRHTHKICIFLWFITFVGASTDSKTCLRPFTVLACESVEEISLKRSTYNEAKH